MLDTVSLQPKKHWTRPLCLSALQRALPRTRMSEILFVAVPQQTLKLSHAAAAW